MKTNLLDHAIREDDYRTRMQHSTRNLAILRPLAIDLLKQEISAEGGIHAKRKQVAQDNNYLDKRY